MNKGFKEFLPSSWAIDHSTVVYVLISIFFILGFSSYISLPRENFPEINSNVIREFVYQQSKLIKPSSQSRLISSLKNFFDYLIIEKIIFINPINSIQYPKIAAKIPETLSTQEIDKLIGYLKKSNKNSLRN